MATDSSQIIVPGTATLWLGAVGTTAPTDSTTTPGAGWSDAGYTTEDGSSLASSDQFGEVFAHQAATAVRVYKTRADATLNVALLQWNTANFEAAFGGGAVTVAAGTAKFAPPAGTVTTPTAALLDFVDGATHFRLVIPKARARAGVTLSLSRTTSTTLPLALTVEATSSVVAPYYLLTDNVTAFTAG